MTDEERDQLISAALDGERVNLEDLRAALASPAGGATAAEFILLRAAVSNDRDGAPGVAAVVAEERQHPRHAGRLLSWPRVPAGIAASLLVAAAAASFWAGKSWRDPAVDSAIHGPTVAVPRRHPRPPRTLNWPRVPSRATRLFLPRQPGCSGSRRASTGTKVRKEASCKRHELSLGFLDSPSS